MSTTQVKDPWMGTKATAAFMGKSVNTVRSLIKDGSLPAKLDGARWKVRQSDAKSFLESGAAEDPEMADLVAGRLMHHAVSRVDEGQMCTYFVQAKGGGPIKIGRTTQFSYRMNKLRLGCPFPLRVLGILLGDHEAMLHQRFADDRLHGEWFKVSWELAVFMETAFGEIPHPAFSEVEA